MSDNLIISIRLNSGQDIIVSIGKIFNYYSYGLTGALRPKILNNNKKYFTDGNFFIVLTTIFVAVESVAGIASIELCSNRSTEILNLDNFIRGLQEPEIPALPIVRQ